MSAMVKQGQRLNELIVSECEKDCSTKDITSFFEFYATYLMMKNFNLSREQIEKGILGGDDGGIDAAYCLINKINLTERAWRDISIPTDSHIVSTEEPHPKVVGLAKELESDLQRKFPNLVEGQVHFVGENTLLELIQTKENLSLPIRIFYKPVCVEKNRYYILVDCQDLYKIPVEAKKDHQTEATGRDVEMAVIQADRLDYPSENRIVLTNPKIKNPVVNLQPHTASKQWVLLITINPMDRM